VVRYRDSKGVKYTEALAAAIEKSASVDRTELRDALAERMVRMTDTTLRAYLDDTLAEIRRAATLGLAKKKSTAHVERMAELLLDPDLLVAGAAHSALCQLSGQDFGPDETATEGEREEAVELWKKWWRAQKPAQK
jgi:HEAT repeat protein